MTETTRLQLTRKDIRNATLEAKRREWWSSFWISVVSIACAIGISALLVWLIG